MVNYVQLITSLKLVSYPISSFKISIWSLHIAMKAYRILSSGCGDMYFSSSMHVGDRRQSLIWELLNFNTINKNNFTKSIYDSEDCFRFMYTAQAYN
jgi:hypothetical protein